MTTLHLTMCLLNWLGQLHAWPCVPVPDYYNATLDYVSAHLIRTTPHLTMRLPTWLGQLHPWLCVCSPDYDISTLDYVSALLIRTTPHLNMCLPTWLGQLHTWPCVPVPDYDDATLVQCPCASLPDCNATLLHVSAYNSTVDHISDTWLWQLHTWPCVYRPTMTTLHLTMCLPHIRDNPPHLTTYVCLSDYVHSPLDLMSPTPDCDNSTLSTWLWRSRFIMSPHYLIISRASHSTRLNMCFMITIECSEAERCHIWKHVLCKNEQSYKTVSQFCGVAKPSSLWQRITLWLEKSSFITVYPASNIFPLILLILYSFLAKKKYQKINRNKCLICTKP